jgi:aryl-alcohol dehydrogenase-like predicted oxidoreductase
MHDRTLGSSGPTAAPIGLGCMGMSWAYSASERDDTASVALLRSAPDFGVTFLDTSDVYGDGHNESLLGEALEGRRDRYVLATKVGLVVDSAATLGMRRDGSPAHIRSAVEASLRRLRTDTIDLYYLHRVDPQVPLEDSWGTMAELVTEGKVRHLGLSEVTVSQAERAHALHAVTAIQSELSLWTRDAQGFGGLGGGGFDEPADGEAPGDVVGWCAEHGAAFVAFSPLGRGFLTGTVNTDALETGDFRAANPRFQPEAQAANQRIVDVVRRIAERREATPAQIAIAWTLAQGEHVFAIPGTKKTRYLRDNAGAGDVELTAEDLRELNSVPEPTGSRY